MADHGYFEELICAELDGELTAEQKAELDAHLRDCGQCRAFRESMAAVEGVSARHLSAPPADLTANVMAAVRAEANRKKKGRIIAFPGRSLAIAAAAALVLWAGVRAADVLRPKGMTAASMAAETESAGAAYENAPEEPVLMMDSTAAEAQEAPEEAPEPEAPAAPPAEPSAEMPAAPAGGLAGNAVPSNEARGGSAPSGEALCQISDRNGPLRELPLSELPRGLLVPDKPCTEPDREPDYIILVYVPEGDPEEYWLWEQDGRMIVETDTGEIGYTLSVKTFRKFLDN